MHTFDCNCTCQPQVEMYLCLYVSRSEHLNAHVFMRVRGHTDLFRDEVQRQLRLKVFMCMFVCYVCVHMLGICVYAYTMFNVNVCTHTHRSNGSIKY